MLKTLIENDDLIFLFAIYGFVSYLRDVGNCIINLFKKKEIKTLSETLSENLSETSEETISDSDSDYDPIKENSVLRKRKRTK